MKAVLARNKREILRTHDFPQLLDLAVVLFPSLASIEAMMLDLNEFSVMVRYPSHVQLEESDAIEALKAVKLIRTAISRLL